MRAPPGRPRPPPSTVGPHPAGRAPIPTRPGPDPYLHCSRESIPRRPPGPPSAPRRQDTWKRGRRWPATPDRWRRPPHTRGGPPRARGGGARGLGSGAMTSFGAPGFHELAEVLERQANAGFDGSKRYLPFLGARLQALAAPVGALQNLALLRRELLEGDGQGLLAFERDHQLLAGRGRGAWLRHLDLDLPPSLAARPVVERVAADGVEPGGQVSPAGVVERRFSPEDQHHLLRQLIGGAGRGAPCDQVRLDPGRVALEEARERRPIGARGDRRHEVRVVEPAVHAPLETGKRGHAGLRGITPERCNFHVLGQIPHLRYTPTRRMDLDIPGVRPRPGSGSNPADHQSDEA